MRRYISWTVCLEFTLQLSAGQEAAVSMTQRRVQPFLRERQSHLTSILVARCVGYQAEYAVLLSQSDEPWQVLRELSLAGDGVEHFCHA